MSLILEALRKSEAERRRGQVPELFDAPAMQPSPAVVLAARPVAGVSPRLMAAGIAAALVLLLGLAWSMRDEPAATTVGDSGLAPVAADAADIVHTAAPARPMPPVPQRGPTPPATVVPSMASATLPVSAASNTATRTPPTTMAPASTPAATSAAASPTVEPSPTASRMAPPAPVLAAPLPAALPAPPRPADDPGMLRLADLAPDERQQLPTLRISMHMWAPEAAQRFVILDGARMAEGDRIGDAVIQSITQDGAVLAWRGRQLKVPVR